MCGIVGFINRWNLDCEQALSVLRRMTDAVRHRGPDDGGLWQSADGNVNLGHRRLSIIDLSPTGVQPMVSIDGRHVIIFNGEVFNFKDIRPELEAAGCTFRGTSDTEVLLVGIQQWGILPMLRRINGQFAFALWDQVERKLTLARDRFGEKPLYYAWHRETLIFGSELKGLMLHPSFCREIDSEGVARLVGFGYIGGPFSIFSGVRKLGAGSYLEARLGAAPEAPRTYWGPHEMLPAPGSPSAVFSDNEVVDRLDTLLRSAISRRMIADVPLGAFLSGGIDSSSIVALMQAQSSRPVKTFSIGFSERAYNEAGDAAKVAKHLGTEHHEMYLSSKDCMDVILRLPEIYDEPFADSSQIPTTLVSAFARRYVSVALTGDAGDEFFGGYNRYFWGQRLWRCFEGVSLGVRVLAGDVIRSLSPSVWENVVRIGNYAVPRRLRVRGGGDKMHKLARVLDAETLEAFYLELVSNPQWSSKVLIAQKLSSNPFSAWDDAVNQLGGIERMMFLDQVTYMTDDILCKVDRASMSVALEARVPFLDNEVTAFAWSLPLASKMRDGIGKWPLRRLLTRYVPQELFDRPKMGFGIPIETWLRGPMREWAEDLLSERSLGNQGWFEVSAVRGSWQEHLSGRRNLIHQIWPVLMFLSWERRWLG